MLDIKFECGFECQVEEDALDDMEMFEDIVHLQKTEGAERESIMHKIFKEVLGPETEESFRAFLRAKDGKVKRTEYSKAAAQLFKDMAEAQKK